MIAENHKNVNELLSVMRDWAETPESQHDWKGLADRIDAAWKRERDELVYSFDPTKAGRSKAPDPSAYAIEGFKAEAGAKAAASSRPCNAAAIRAAIENVISDIDKIGGFGDGRIHFADIVRIGNIKAELKSAIAAPLRNCDRFKTRDDAVREYLHLAARAALPDEEAVDIADWLFSTVRSKGEKV